MGLALSTAHRPEAAPVISTSQATADSGNPIQTVLGNIQSTFNTIEDGVSSSLRTIQGGISGAGNRIKDDFNSLTNAWGNLGPDVKGLVGSSGYYFYQSLKSVRGLGPALLAAEGDLGFILTTVRAVGVAALTDLGAAGLAAIGTVMAAPGVVAVITIGSLAFVIYEVYDLYNSSNQSVTTETVSVNPPDLNGVVKGSGQFSNTDGSTLTYTYTQPANGSVTVTSTGPSTFGFTYTPTDAAQQAAEATGKLGSDTFRVNAYNASGQSAVALITVPIDPGTPQAGTPPYIVSAPDSSGVVTGSAVFTNPAGDKLKYSVTSDPAKGTITAFDPNTGKFTYTPNPDATGTEDTFTVTATNGIHSGTETIAVPVGEDPLVGTWVSTDPSSANPPRIKISKVGAVYTETLDGPYYTFMDGPMGVVAQGPVVATFTRIATDDRGNPTYTGTITAQFIAAWNAANINLYTPVQGQFSRAFLSSSIAISGVLVFTSDLPPQFIETSSPTPLHYTFPDFEPFDYPDQQIFNGGWYRM
jgi:hypothetical protein